MTTLTCTIAGSALAGANASRSITLSDADLQRVLNWLNATQLQLVADHFNGGATQGFVPTNGQLEWAWMQVSVINGTKSAVQNFETSISQPAAPVLT